MSQPVLKQSEMVRQTLKMTLPQAQAVGQKMDSDKANDDSEIAAQYLLADSMIRRANSFFLPATGQNPAVELRKMNLQQLLLSHAHNEVLTFLGAAGKNETDYWKLAANNYLKSAGKVYIGNTNFPTQQMRLQG